MTARKNTAKTSRRDMKTAETSDAVMLDILNAAKADPDFAAKLTVENLASLELPPIEEQLANITVTEGTADELVAGLTVDGPSAAEIDAAVSHLEAIESQVQVDEAAAVHEGQAETPTFDQLRESFDEQDVDDTVYAIAEECDSRAAFETDKNPDNTNIHKTLKKVRSQLVTKRAAKVMLAANITPAFINRSENQGSRYNVYALGKLADVIFGVTDGTISNAINLACMKSLFRCAKAGVPFTMEVAKAAASDKIRVDAAIKQHLIRHTVSASTAPTQASSTMQALETLGVVRAEGSKKNPTFHLTNHPIVAYLEDKLLAA